MIMQDHMALKVFECRLHIEPATHARTCSHIRLHTAICYHYCDIDTRIYSVNGLSGTSATSVMSG